ncbi:MAG: hypothetical protein VXY75_00825, partial [Bacteroidota bacterium]|nr:hypothetical protein [Bacteroidota bacterium]
ALDWSRFLPTKIFEMDFIKAKSLYWLFILFQYQNTSCDKAAKYAHFLGFRNYKTQQITYKIR